ncbi:hypothetical protein IQ265_09060 [Nodosilinea sp. LEGE 06152]|uniref:hypothetical protein n=1 Tax=Nodosilinea sp. LEGE 06152 TaxID=2777966 RepID=UPI001881CB4E|nr:hypothetical protein [Nodosilinea sp. LEGE 06152]MBE9156975.1 hypothetical protein [Nodosilinea sp. LEGE 06152]
MKRTALFVLTAAIAATTFSPASAGARSAYGSGEATTDKVAFEKLRQENLDKVNFDKLREANLDKVNFDKLRQENLSKANQI